jgi:hypothetical protein
MHSYTRAIILSIRQTPYFQSNRRCSARDTQVPQNNSFARPMNLPSTNVTLNEQFCSRNAIWKRATHDMSLEDVQKAVLGHSNAYLTQMDFISCFVSS